MTSLLGMASAETRLSLATELEAMLAAVYREPWYQASRRVDEGGRFAVARLAHGYADLGAAGATTPGTSNSLTLFGDIYQMPGGPNKRPERQFLEQYASRGDRFLEEVQGAFVAVMFDESAGMVRIANDRFGQRPLYYSVLDDVLYFSTSLAALFAAGVPAKVSAAGMAQFFTFGQYLGCDTLYQDIQVLPAGSLLEFSTETGARRVRRYVGPWAGAHRNRTPSQWLDAICDAMVPAVRRSSSGTAGLGLALSGGLDARTILGLINHEQVDLKTVCLGMQGSLDLQCAQQMAALVGCRHHSHLLDEAFLGNFEAHLNRMVDLTGGQYLSQCIVIPTLPVYREQGIRVLLRGHAGELMHMRKAYAYSIDDAALSISSREEAQDWLFSHLQSYMLKGVPGGLFQGDYTNAMATAPREAFEQSFAELPDLEDPRQAIWHYFVNERLRRETTLSLGKFASVCDVRVPMLDADLIGLLLAAPVELKQDETIQRHILKRCRPQLLSVVNANVGAPMKAGLLKQQAAKLKMRVFAKLGVPGYQPYERTGLWLRRELDGLVRRILLDEQCLDRGVFRPDAVRQVIDGHGTKTANHTYLILAMMIFEIGQRRLGGAQPCGVRVGEVACEPA
ncbi:asparagine synthase-related protein [Candidatus Laterigemmans baculatus]|uniref:asparagine synthase-related protein n=1 Tax=Candidatus Laterigemmans baculatus TaxID=2770505 RepID=UPI0013DC3784|nr:asparagine synthase-related protein [Candidatus Laterigemmans baculatus]